MCDRVAIIVEGHVRHAGATDGLLGEAEPQADLVLAAVPVDLPAQLEERYAARLRGHGDVLLIAGKGHETGQIVGAAVLPFSDHEAVRAALAETPIHV